MAENPAVMESFIPENPNTEKSQPRSKFADSLRKMAIVHFVFGGLSVVTEVVYLVLWRESSIYDLGIPGLICGIMWGMLGALPFCVGPLSHRNWMIAGIILTSVSMLLALGVLVINAYLLLFLAILAEEFIALMLMNIFMIPFSIGGFVNCCFHIHYSRKLLQK